MLLLSYCQPAMTLGCCFFVVETKRKEPGARPSSVPIWSLIKVFNRPNSGGYIIVGHSFNSSVKRLSAFHHFLQADAFLGDDADGIDAVGQ